MNALNDWINSHRHICAPEIRCINIAINNFSLFLAVNFKRKFKKIRAFQFQVQLNNASCYKG